MTLSPFTWNMSFLLIFIVKIQIEIQRWVKGLDIKK